LLTPAEAIKVDFIDANVYGKFTDLSLVEVTDVLSC
jgi:hypothetical protein